MAAFEAVCCIYVKKNAEKETEMNASWFFSVSGKIKKFYSSKKMTR